jgi:hypothetical protein
MHLVSSRRENSGEPAGKQTWPARRALNALRATDEGALLQTEVLAKEEVIAAVKNGIVVVEIGCAAGVRQAADRGRSIVIAVGV